MTHRRWRAGLVAAAALSLAVTLIGWTGTATAATLFTDDFADGDSAGWTTSGGTWSVAADGTPVLRQSGTSADARALAGTATWSDYTVTARVKPTAFNGANRFAALAARVQSATSYYYLALRSNNTVELKRLSGGSSATLAAAPVTVTINQWYALSLTVSGTSLRGTVNGAVTVSATDSAYSSGRIGLATFNASANFDDVLVDGGTSTPPTSAPPTSRPPTTNPPTSAPPSTTVPPPPSDRPIGFASLNTLGQNGTTGGAGGPTVVVTTAAQLIDYAARTGPYVIRVSGTITLPTGTSDGMYAVASDKTIIGIGATARIENGGLTIGLPVDDAVTAVPANAVRNIIIRNLSFSGASDDAINVQMFSHHIWIDHNDLCCGGDGLVDIKRGSDFVTVSWNRTHDHNKTMLLGHDDANGPQDIGHLRVTYHHNFFDGSDQRNPRVRFGEPVHVYNNYCRNASYCIVSAMDAGLVVENNYFDTVNNPGRVDFSGDLGRLVARGNILVNVHHPIETRGTVVEPSTYYSYPLDAAADIPTIVPAGAGVGKINA
jgi:pectate lyase